MDAQQRRAGEGPVQVDLEQRFDRTETQRPDVEAFERSRCDGTFEVGPAVVGGHSAGEQQRDRLGHPAQRERQCIDRRAVEPLDVVDGDDGAVAGRAAPARRAWPRRGLAGRFRSSASASSNAASIARRRGGECDSSTASTTPSNRSPIPAKASPCFACVGRDTTPVTRADAPRRRPSARGSTSRRRPRLRGRAHASRAARHRGTRGASGARPSDQRCRAASPPRSREADPHGAPIPRRD